MISAGTSQAIYYSVTGTAPYRTTIFEFYEAHRGSSYSYSRFQIIFYENSPNIVRYAYLRADDRGASATIGVQGE